MSIRINRFFTDQGTMSRRAADEAVSNGRVKINGKRAKLGDQVNPGDKVMLDGTFVGAVQKLPVIIVFNKPVGIECTSDPRVENNVIDVVNYPERVFHIGRLDKDSEGLLLLTNRGEIVNEILRSHNDHEKEYVVDLSGPISDLAIKDLSAGVILEDGRTKPCKVRRLAERRVLFVLTEGKNRQIRRMVEHVGLGVEKLQRVRIMNIRLGKLPVGEWRDLTADEETELHQQLAKDKKPAKRK